jgi:hypothetical protein
MVSLLCLDFFSLGGGHARSSDLGSRDCLFCWLSGGIGSDHQYHRDSYTVASLFRLSSQWRYMR